MEKVHIQKTKTSPEVVLDSDANTAMIEGESYPENAVEFYKPVFSWLNNHIGVQRKLDFVFKLNYFNTSSSKCIMDILDQLNDYHNNNGEVSVKWMYQEDDDDMMESGQEFGDDLDLKFELESYST